MGTVGEMVKERGKQHQEALLRECPEAANGSVSSLAAMWLEAIRSLGIWDAEVLECECKKDDFECEAFYPVTRNWRALGLEYGDRVRVIVLKEE